MSQRITETINIDILELYKLAAKKCAEYGYPLTKDRIWDHVCSIGIRAGIMKKHKSQFYFDELRKLGLLED